MFGASVTDIRTHCRFEMVYRYEVSDTSILTEQNAKVGSMPSASANAPSTPPFVATAAARPLVTDHTVSASTHGATANNLSPDVLDQEAIQMYRDLIH